MDGLKLIRPSAEYARQIDEYRAEFPIGGMDATFDPDRIPGLDRLEEFDTVQDWLNYCDSEKDRVSWYMLVRTSDGRIVGSGCLRRKLEYDDDDIDFCSHIGYSIRPSERRKGYGTVLLALILEKAKEQGLDKVRLICRDTNTGSSRIILNNGGVFIDSLYGDESGMTVNRYDIILT